MDSSISRKDIHAMLLTKIESLVGEKPEFGAHNFRIIDVHQEDLRYSVEFYFCQDQDRFSQYDKSTTWKGLVSIIYNQEQNCWESTGSMTVVDPGDYHYYKQGSTIELS